MSEDTNDKDIKRNYDKDPIVIEDYNPLFMALICIYTIPTMIYVYIYNPGHVSTDSLFRNMVIIVPLLMYPYLKGYFKNRGKRKIYLLNQTIRFAQENNILEEIELSKISDIRKTYSDLYHKSQYLTQLGKFLAYILFPLIILLGHIPLLINKSIFHTYKDGFKSYKFLDAIIVYEDKRFINILPTTLKEYGDVKEYFEDRLNIDVSGCKPYYEILGHVYEKI